MGGTISSLFYRLFWNQEVKIAMVGLDYAGKTTILYQLKLGEIVTTIPTIGYNVETIVYKNLSLTISDLRGGCHIQQTFWAHILKESPPEAIIFVVDSTDVERLDEAAEALDTLLSQLNDDVQHSSSGPLLVYANKQDLPGAMDVSELDGRLKPKNLGNWRWHVQGGAATTGAGLYEGLDWLCQNLEK